MTAKKIFESEWERAKRLSDKRQQYALSKKIVREERVKEFLASQEKVEIPVFTVPVQITDQTPVLLKSQNDGYITVNLSVAEVEMTVKFKVKNLSGNLFGRHRTKEGLKEMIQDALKTKFGRVEDGN
jgi:hypothetical protein